ASARLGETALERLLETRPRCRRALRIGRQPIALRLDIGSRAADAVVLGGQALELRRRGGGVRIPLAPDALEVAIAFVEPHGEIVLAASRLLERPLERLLETRPRRGRAVRVRRQTV